MFHQLPSESPNGGTWQDTHSNPRGMPACPQGGSAMQPGAGDVPSQPGQSCDRCRPHAWPGRVTEAGPPGLPFWFSVRVKRPGAFCGRSSFSPFRRGPRAWSSTAGVGGCAVPVGLCPPALAESASPAQETPYVAGCLDAIIAPSEGVPWAGAEVNARRGSEAGGRQAEPTWKAWSPQHRLAPASPRETAPLSCRGGQGARQQRRGAAPRGSIGGKNNTCSGQRQTRSVTSLKVTSKVGKTRK